MLDNSEELETATVETSVLLATFEIYLNLL